MLTITAETDFRYDDETPNGSELGVEVTVTGHNMSEELAVLVAKQAVCMAAGLDLESFDSRYMEDEVELEPSQAIVRFLA